jgi:hypothetical protein
MHTGAFASSPQVVLSVKTCGATLSSATPSGLVHRAVDVFVFSRMSQYSPGLQTMFSAPQVHATSAASLPWLLMQGDRPPPIPPLPIHFGGPTSTPVRPQSELVSFLLRSLVKPSDVCSAVNTPSETSFSGGKESTMPLAAAFAGSFFAASFRFSIFFSKTFKAASCCAFSFADRLSCWARIAANGSAPSRPDKSKLSTKPKSTAGCAAVPSAPPVSPEKSKKFEKASSS